MPSGTQVHVVVLMADLSGYTALTETHGNVHAAGVVSRYLELAAETLAPGARLLERVGDELVIVTAEPASAVQTALGLRRAVEREPLFPAVRAGLHAGPVVEQGGGYVGAALNVTSRVTGQARPGQILCTSAVAEAVGGLPGVAYRPLGEIRLRNVPTPVALFEIVDAERHAAAAVDPVCRMQITPDAATPHATVGGISHHFCSVECRDAFIAHPDLYSPA